MQVCLRFVQFKKHAAELAGVPGGGKMLLPLVVGAAAAAPAIVEHGLTHDKYWLLQAYEQLEKVGPAGSPVGEDGVGEDVARGYKLYGVLLHPFGNPLFSTAIPVRPYDCGLSR